MNQLSLHILSTLALASLGVFFAGVLISVALRLMHCRTPGLRQFAWMLVLVQGILWLPPVCRYTISTAMPRPSALPTNASGQGTQARLVEAVDRPIPDQELAEAIRPGIDNPAGYVVPLQSMPLQSILWSSVLMAWFLGMGFLFVKRMQEYFRFVARRDLEECRNLDWNAELASLCQKLGIRRSIPLFCSNDIGPAFCRWPKEYRIVVPYRLWQQLSAIERKSILLHELGHFQRGDLAWTLALHLIAVLHWFNPMAWFAMKQIENNMELACDDLVRLARDELGVSTYAKALLTVGQFSSRSSIGVAAIDGACLAERIRRVLGPFDSRESKIKQLLLFCLLTGLCMTNLVRVQLWAQQPLEAKTQAQSPSSVSESVSDKELDDAILDLRFMGGFVREFHPRNAKEHWIQIILEGDPKKSGFQFDKPSNAPKDPKFDDDMMDLVRVLCLSSPAHVHFRNCQFTEVGFSLLQGTKVDRLELTGLNITDKHLESLPRMTSMRELSLANTSVTETGFNQLSKCNQLESLDFESHPNISTPASALLVRMPKLKSVSLKLSLDDVEHLNQFEQLESLSVVLDDAAAATAFRELKSLGQLRSLTMNGKWNNSDLIVFAARQSPRLESLYLRQCHEVTAEAAAAISSLDGLKILSIDNANFGDEELKLLTPLSHLTWFDLSDTKVSDRSLKAIGQLSNLGYLGLSRTNVSEAGLENLQELHNLFHLDLRGTYVKSVPEWMRARTRLQISLDSQRPLGVPEKAAAKEQSALDRAVDEFNAKAGKDPTGKFEPPLTTEEVVAAIRSWDRASIPIDDEKFALFDQIAKTGHMPIGTTIGYTTRWLTPEFNYHVWWVDLNVMTDANQGFTFRMRARTLSSQKNNR